MAPAKPSTMDAYIAGFTPEIRTLLQQVRATIHKAAPDATEAITYGIPTSKLGGKNLVHFAGYARHIGFYSVPSGIAAFKRELAGYKQGKGSVQFPVDKGLPVDLIARIVKFRVMEHRAK